MATLLTHFHNDEHHTYLCFLLCLSYILLSKDLRLSKNERKQT